ncbi:MAG: hypothetical protein AAB729_04565 [Patescibacteria group bacterium]
MDQTITVEELVGIIEQSALDNTIKTILIRDIKSEGVTEFLLEQVIAYCDNAIDILKGRLKDRAKNNPTA